MSNKKVKIGVISDTHLDDYDEKLKKSVEEHFNDADIILHAGDMVGLSVLEIFGNKEIKAVCGNMDHSSIKEKFPERLLFEINGFKFLLTHGWGSASGIEERISSGLKDIDCVVYGHTHQPANHRKDNTLFFNPGSAVDRYFNSSKTIGILEIDKDITGRIIKI